MNKKRIYFFVGTTAELIKLAPIIRGFKKRKIKFKFITSGQTKVLFEDLNGYIGNIKVDIAFKEKSKKSSVFLFGVWALRTFFTALISLGKEFEGLNKENSYFIIHGDTVSSLIGALIAKIYGLKLVHVESGLRSFNFLEPFPEEICRYCIIHIANILFAPTEWALGNLKSLPGEKICTGENTLIETCWWAIKTGANLGDIGKSRKYYILTMHRQEHILFRKEWTKDILRYVIKNTNRNLDGILVTHHLTASFLQNFNPQKLTESKITVLSRLPYLKFMKLMNKAEFIATDGCTNQEEAYYMGLPLLALRNRTERIEGLGQNVVISKDSKKNIRKFIQNYKKFKRKPVTIKKMPSEIIVDYLLKNRETLHK